MDVEWRSMITLCLHSERSIISTPFFWAGRYRPPISRDVGLYLQTLSCGFDFGLGI